jgi:hypothetical protein
VPEAPGAPTEEPVPEDLDSIGDFLQAHGANTIRYENRAGVDNSLAQAAAAEYREIWNKSPLLQRHPVSNIVWSGPTGPDWPTFAGTYHFGKDQLTVVTSRQFTDYVLTSCSKTYTVGAKISKTSAEYVASTVRHELGHALYARSSPKMAIAFQNVYRSKYPRTWAQIISKYSTRSMDEFVAEAFDLYTSPGYTRRTLPVELEELLEKMMKTGKI